MKFALKLALIGWAGLVGFIAQTASATDYTLEEVVNGLDMPWGIAFLPDGDILVTELSGQLRLVREGELQDWRELKAISYNIDEEMAYYYVPAQVMDHWENTYFWFDHRGHPGVCRSWRLGTGGAWSPNKFQRISTIVMAWV